MSWTGYIPGYLLRDMTPREHTLYRVESPDTGIGLWYAEDGSFTDYIKTIDNALNRDLPMGFDPAFREGGSRVSAADSMEQLALWVSPSDMRQLVERGYYVWAFVVPSYRTLNGHAVFLREQVIRQYVVSHDELYDTEEVAA